MISGFEPGCFNQYPPFKIWSCKSLVKSLDGYIRTEKGGIPDPDQLSSIVSGFLESSNVKSVDQLVAGIEQSRAYEINVKFITTAKELDEAGASLMRIPN